MRIETSRDTEENNDGSIKRLDTTTVWVFGTREELDKFEKFVISKNWEDADCGVRESHDVEGELYSDFFNMDWDEVSAFKKDVYMEFKKTLKK